jgi:hypothetical protein
MVAAVVETTVAMLLATEEVARQQWKLGQRQWRQQKHGNGWWKHWGSGDDSRKIGSSGSGRNGGSGGSGGNSGSCAGSHQRQWRGQAMAAKTEAMVVADNNQPESGRDSGKNGGYGSDGGGNGNHGGSNNGGNGSDGGRDGSQWLVAAATAAMGALAAAEAAAVAAVMAS